MRTAISWARTRPPAVKRAPTINACAGSPNASCKAGLCEMAATESSLFGSAGGAHWRRGDSNPGTIGVRPRSRRVRFSRSPPPLHIAATSGWRQDDCRGGCDPATFRL